MTQKRPLIVQQEKLLRSAVSDYIDRIVDGCGLRQRVITQPRPGTEVALLAKSYRLAVATVGAAWLSPISATTTPTT